MLARRCCQKNANDAASEKAETPIDFKVSCSNSSCGTPMAGTMTIISDSSRAVELGLVFVNVMVYWIPASRELAPSLKNSCHFRL